MSRRTPAAPVELLGQPSGALLPGERRELRDALTG
jgi:hypothetical protein